MRMDFPAGAGRCGGTVGFIQADTIVVLWTYAKIFRRGNAALARTMVLSPQSTVAGGFRARVTPRRLVSWALWPASPPGSPLAGSPAASARPPPPGMAGPPAPP